VTKAPRYLPIIGSWELIGMRGLASGGLNNVSTESFDIAAAIHLIVLVLSLNSFCKIPSCLDTAKWVLSGI
jgi:hypothetical protein